ncbi:MAG: T9SS type A sorting domain-containing protein [Bacteroidota bacterium]|nr:T9SS type A sorting domain-containing protein [Bacteroidota bacterium]
MKKITLLALVLLAFGSQAQISLGTGVALSYTFTGNANDGSGNAFHGTVVGATLTTDRFSNPNQAYDFNGSTDYINSGNILNSVFAGTGNKFSISVWVKPADYMANNMIMAKIADGACSEDERQFYFRLWNGKIMFGYSSSLITGNYRYPTGSTLITDTSKWYHIVVMYDGTINTGGGMDRVKMYVDDVAETISVGAPSTGILGNIQVGAAPMGVGDYLNTSGTQCNATAFIGKIDDIRIYDRPLNTAEINALYTGPSTVGVAEEQPEMITKFYPNPGSGILNYSISGLDGNVKMDILDLSGRNVYTTEFQNNAATMSGSLDITNLSEGIYFVRIENKSSKLLEKIVIVK